MSKYEHTLGLQLYWKRDSDVGVFQRILQNFQEHLFWRTFPNDLDVWQGYEHASNIHVYDH